MRFMWISLILLFFVDLGYSQIYISEIDFGDFEFIEIYSNQSLNLTGKKVYDSNLDKFNQLNLIQEKNSPYYLIVGNKFIENSNLSNFNCSVYLTDKSQVSNGGLKSNGENLLIGINSSFNLSYVHKQNFVFSQNESLNYNFSQGLYYVSNKSICGKNYNFVKLLKNSSNNNASQSVLVDFNLEIKDFLVFDRVYFEFDTNVSNFTIEYWVEDYLGNIVKKKRKTSNLNSKSWSPKGISNVYVVKGILNSKNLSLNISKMFYYYSNQTYLVEIEEDEIKKEKDISKILIRNKNDLLNEKTTNLKYEIYKGNTLKRTIYFYLNGDKIHSIEVNKYSSLNGNLELKNYLINGKNELLIKGLGLEEDLLFEINNIFSKDFSNNKVLTSNKKLYFNSVSLNNSLILFNLISKLENKGINCYINFEKTKVSNELKFNLKKKNYILKLEINNSKLKLKNFQNGDFLKLICKYNQSNYFKYFSEEFNYFFPKEINSRISSNGKINFYSFNRNSSNKKKDNLNLKKNLVLIDNNFSQNNLVNIISNNLKIKELSFNFLFGVLILIICILILKW